MSIKNYSVYSTDAGLLKIDNIINQEFTKKTKKAFLTDFNTLSGVPYFFDACHKKGVDAVIGVTVLIGNQLAKEGNITLYAKNENGFNNLKKIVSNCNEDDNKEKFVDMYHVLYNKEDLICLTGGHNTVLYNLIKNEEIDSATKYAFNLKKSFGENLAFEIQVNYLNNEKRINDFIIKLSKELNVNVLATNNNRMIKESHYPLLVEKVKQKKGINNKRNNEIYDNLLPSDFIQSSEQLSRNFEIYKNDISSISKVFNNIIPYTPFVELPTIPTFENLDDEYFSKTLTEKYNEFIKKVPSDKISLYNTRIKEEIEILKELGFEKYFVIFEQIEKNKKENQRFNLRGSSVGFLITHILGLSDIDPVENGLLAERFLNKNRLIRKELPDIDLESNDIDSIALYLKETFGEKNAAYLSQTSSPKAMSQIGLAEKALLEDIKRNPTNSFGRKRVFPDEDFKLLKKVVSSMYGHKEKTLDELFKDGYISKKIAAERFDIKGDFNSYDFKQSYYKISNLTNLCKNNPNIKKLFGFIKNLDGVIISQSPSYASIVVSNEPIENTFSTEKVKIKDKPILLSIEAGKKQVEKLGLVKLDILPNKYLEKLINCYDKTNLDWNNFEETPLKNQQVYDMLSNGFTETLNQIKSENQKILSKKIGFENFSDITSFLALIRPAIGKENVDKYIFNKNNKNKVLYETPEMKEILEETNGIIIFEEQIMLISQKIGNFSKEESDDFRSLMKKVGSSSERNDNFNKLESMKKDLITRAIEQNKIAPNKAKSIMDKLNDMQGYTFSKAHSISYAGLLYRQAFMDANYPAEYFQTHLLDSKNNLTSESNGYFKKLTDMGRSILNVDINRSGSNFKTRRKDINIFIDPSINYILKNDDFSEIIVKGKRKGPYQNIYDFINRTIHTVIDKNKYDGDVLTGECDIDKMSSSYKVYVQKLIKAGAFDNIVPPELKEAGINILRGTLLNSLDDAIKLTINPFLSGNFEYKVPEYALSMEATLADENSIYGISPTTQRLQVFKTKKNNTRDKKQINKNRP